MEPVDEAAPSEPPVEAAEVPTVAKEEVEPAAPEPTVEEPESEIAVPAEVEPTPELEVADEAPTGALQEEVTPEPVQPSSVQEPSDVSKPTITADPTPEVATEGTGPSVPQGISCRPDLLEGTTVPVIYLPSINALCARIVEKSDAQHVMHLCLSFHEVHHLRFIELDLRMGSLHMIRFKDHLFRSIAPAAVARISVPRL